MASLDIAAHVMLDALVVTTVLKSVFGSGIRVGLQDIRTVDARPAFV
ncbi:MAG: hypothetical protein ACRDK2_10175 [Solirubrobacteraceae bacterium]